jgi:hypothetical protein
VLLMLAKAASFWGAGDDGRRLSPAAFNVLIRFPVPADHATAVTPFDSCVSRSPADARRLNRKIDEHRRQYVRFGSILLKNSLHSLDPIFSAS